ncbi:putative matrix protein [Pectobacterium atrosepticum SCRI1043]|uniref:Matrix protein n=1 Tax=Pectobacterium atrosepticum (strain SCRI 1043 / ATCC BAA-672) TaxID=218491 RepID=Q6D0G0_PECAS|nr:putative matrix protein [Pectobacterium atrosepticum SCRI1043]
MCFYTNNEWLCKCGDQDDSLTLCNSLRFELFLIEMIFVEMTLSRDGDLVDKIIFRGSYFFSRT